MWHIPEKEPLQWNIIVGTSYCHSQWFYWSQLNKTFSPRSVAPTKFLCRTAIEWNSLPASLFSECYKLGLLKAVANSHYLGLNVWSESLKWSSSLSTRLNAHIILFKEILPLKQNNSWLSQEILNHCLYDLAKMKYSTKFEKFLLSSCWNCHYIKVRDWYYYAPFFKNNYFLWSLYYDPIRWTKTCVWAWRSYRFWTIEDRLRA